MLLSEFALWALLVLSAITIIVGSARKLGFEIIISSYAVLSVVANIVAVKLISVGEIVAPAGVIVYSVTFLLTDFLSELYGKEIARKAVISGFIANIVYLIAINSVLYWTPAPFVNQDFIKAFNSVFNQTPRIVIASLVAYIISQTNDVYVFHRIRRITGRKHLWVRNNLSTALSQFIDTAVFITIAFYGSAPLLTLITGQYALKLLIALLDTPFLYISVRIFELSEKNSNITQG